MHTGWNWNKIHSSTKSFVTNWKFQMPKKNCKKIKINCGIEHSKETKKKLIQLSTSAGPIYKKN